MNNVYEELDEAKGEIKKLKAELRGKKRSYKNLKRSHDVQVNQIQEAISKVEKLEQELLQKADEFIYADQIHECHNSNFSLVERQEQHGTNDQLKQFKPCTKECESEKSTLLDEISFLKSKLDSHIKVSQDLQHQLHMCKQLLAHEESQRKSIEVEVLDLKLKSEGLNSQKDKDIEDLRKAFKIQEVYYKESKYSNEKLEQENQQLRKSLRELQESQDARASYSISMLRSNLRGLQKTHRECVKIFKARQVEWSFQLEQMSDNIDNYRYALEVKAATIEKLKKELECSQSFNIEMMLLNEEMFVMLLVLKEGISEHKELQNSQRNEHNIHKDMLEESTKCKTKMDLKEQLFEVYNALDKPNIELDDRTCEISEMEFELQMWKSFVKSLKNDLEENRVMRKALENSLLAQVDFNVRLKQKIDSLEHKLEEEENKINYLQLHLFVLEQALKERDTKASEPEQFRREFDSVVIEKCNVERTNEFEKEIPIKGKNMAKNELMKYVTSLKKEFISSLIPFNSQLTEKHAEIIQVQEVCDKITEAEALAIIEFEEKKLMIEELEDDINDMENKLKLQEENLSQLKLLACDIEMEIDAKQLKIKQLNDHLENKLRGSDVLLQKIKIENRSLLDNGARLSLERENLLSFIMGLGDKMNDCTTTDTNLVHVLRSLVQSFEKECVGGMNLKNDDGLFVKENMIVHSPTGLNKPESLSDIRSPFVELDNKLQ